MVPGTNGRVMAVVANAETDDGDDNVVNKWRVEEINNGMLYYHIIGMRKVKGKNPSVSLCLVI